MTMPLRHTLLFITALALGVACSPARAADLFLNISGTSQHSKENYFYRGVSHEYNRRNTGLGLTVGLNKYFEASGGFFHNSYGRWSTYGSVTLKHDLTHNHFRITPGISVGLATGYRHTPVHAATLQPAFIASVRATWHGVGFTVGYIPRANMGEGIPVSAITLQANVQLNKYFRGQP